MSYRQSRHALYGPRELRAFTLVELLVVVSVIALLISILLPSLKKAREQAKAVKCAANSRQVGQAMSTYLAEGSSCYPPAYVYPTDQSASWTPTLQATSPVPNGYLHWSHFLYSGGKVKADAFQCPSFLHGGAPRTNPGLKREDWELGVQKDAGGNVNPNSLADKQAPRMAYAPNAAVVPRNKFTNILSGGVRHNVFVNENYIKRPGDTILIAEYLRNWKALGISDHDKYVLCKSHRPINVFYHLSSSFNEYEAPEQSPGFIYGTKGSARTAAEYGLLKTRDVENKTNVLDWTSGIAQINAVGRHHPGGDSIYGGTGNYTFVDGHTERLTPLQTLKQRKWGDRYYSLSGRNEVLNMAAPQ